MGDFARTAGGLFPYLHVSISISAVFHISPHYFILKKYRDCSMSHVSCLTLFFSCEGVAASSLGSACISTSPQSCAECWCNFVSVGLVMILGSFYVLVLGAKSIFFRIAAPDDLMLLAYFRKEHTTAIPRISKGWNTISSF